MTPHVEPELQPHERRALAAAPQVQRRLVAARQSQLHALVLVDAQRVEVIQGHADPVHHPDRPRVADPERPDAEAVDEHHPDPVAHHGTPPLWRAIVYKITVSAKVSSASRDGT
jgi:hypothetical protein